MPPSSVHFNGSVNLPDAETVMREISSRIVVRHGGRIIEDGSPQRVLDEPQHERTRAFLGLDREEGRTAKGAA